MAKQYDNWRDLAEFGIESLTGEACGLGLRILCDVNEDGLKLIRTVVGAVEMRVPSAWNGGKIEGKDKVGSVMLAYDLFPMLVIFGLTSQGRASWAVVTDSNGVYAIDSSLSEEQQQKDMDKYAHFFKGNIRRVQIKKQTRNVHQMSGRVE